jgi:hypothetical protein
MFYYALKNKIPVLVPDVLEWAKEMERDRHVADTRFDNGLHVSTVFLGIDHSWSGGPPLLFETMVFRPCNRKLFGKQLDEEEDERFPLERYSTWEEAEKGHNAMLESIKKAGI